MVEKLIGLIKSPRFGEVFRFVVNGGVCFVVEYIIMHVLIEYTNLAEWICIGVGFSVSVILNYILCLVWVFKGAKKQTLESQLIFIGSSVVGFGINEVLMLYALNTLHMNDFIAKAIVTLIVMVWNFFMKRIAIYGVKKRK